MLYPIVARFHRSSNSGYCYPTTPCPTYVYMYDDVDVDDAVYDDVADVNGDDDDNDIFDMMLDIYIYIVVELKYI